MEDQMMFAPAAKQQKKQDNSLMDVEQQRAIAEIQGSLIIWNWPVLRSPNR